MFRGRDWACVCVCLTVVVGIASPVRAQIGAGALAGDVVDQGGAAVPGATVTVIAVGTNLSRTVVTSQDGAYSVSGLAPGPYQMRVKVSGFRPLTRDGIRLATGETVRLDLRLELGGVSEAITVTADAPLLRSETSGLGHVVDNRRVIDVPLNGRSFITLASLIPGVTLPPPPAAPLPRINGGRPRTNEYLFDGISVLQPEPGQVAFFPNVDAIQEFKIESNSPPAEFGRFNGGVVNLTTKSGSNAFQGTAFGFVRNEALNARNFFASANPAKPRFRRNQFGGVAGGPIRRDRTFFFGKAMVDAKTELILIDRFIAHTPEVVGGPGARWLRIPLQERSSDGIHPHHGNRVAGERLSSDSTRGRVVDGRPSGRRIPRSARQPSGPLRRQVIPELCNSRSSSSSREQITLRRRADASAFA